MTDALDVELYDSIALRELHVMTDLMIAANTTEHRLSHDAIDSALGLARVAGRHG
jgi:hypothetical protein